MASPNPAPAPVISATRPLRSKSLLKLTPAMSISIPSRCDFRHSRRKQLSKGADAITGIRKSQLNRQYLETVLAEDAGVAEGVAAGLGIDAQAVGALSDLDAGQQIAVGVSMA